MPACAPTAPPPCLPRPYPPEPGLPLGVLITRPEAEAGETAARVTGLGLMPVLAPTIRIVPRALDLSRVGRLQAILVTSGNSLAALPAALHATPLLAVGDATAARACAAGFWRVSSAGRDAAALAEAVVLACDPARGKLLQLSGAGVGLGLLDTLRKCRFQVLRRVAYAAHAASALPPDAWQALARRELHAALFFSPATAQAFVRMVQRRGPEAAMSLATVTAIAISPTTAAALTPLPWKGIRVASRPNQDELLAWLR